MRAAAAFAAVMTLLPQAAAAQGADQFFKGKTINLYIGFGPGGTYDYYGRLVARFIGRHIPGEPTVVAQSMPGSGGLRAANYLFSAAPKDGTAVAVVTQTAAIEDALRSPGVQYKAAEFNWIGRMTAILEVHFTWKTSKGKTIEDARQHEIPLAGTGSGSPSEGYPKLLNAFAGTKFKIISGYPSSTEGMIAMERGEVDGALTSWNTIKRTRPQWIQNRDINVLVQYGAERHPEMRDIPTYSRNRADAGGQGGDGVLHRRCRARSLLGCAARIAGGAREGIAHGVRRHAQGSRLPGRDREERAGVLSSLGRTGAKTDRGDRQCAAQCRRADGSHASASK